MTADEEVEGAGEIPEPDETPGFLGPLLWTSLALLAVWAATAVLISWG